MQGLSNSLALEVTVSVLHHVLPCHESALGMCQPIHHLYLMFFSVLCSVAYCSLVVVG